MNFPENKKNTFCISFGARSILSCPNKSLHSLANSFTTAMFLMLSTIHQKVTVHVFVVVIVMQYLCELWVSGWVQTEIH